MQQEPANPSGDLKRHREAPESPSREQRLQEMLVACVEAAEKGQALDRQTLATQSSRPR
jgi:hypothetical protein